MPGIWRGTLLRCIEAAKVTKARGICADPEMGWAKASAKEKTELCKALASVADSGDWHVILTTHTGLRKFSAQLSLKLGPLGSIGSPQVYDHQMGESFDRPARVCAEWAKQNWAHVVPSVGSFGRDTKSFTEYFAALPKSFGGLIWYAGTAPTGVRLASIHKWAA